MREWALSQNDPLALTFSADGRLVQIDARDDHIWELEWGSGEPPALSLFTTYGLRARSMRIFHRFREGNRAVLAPQEFARPPLVRALYPNFLHLTFWPFEGIEVQAEYWVAESHAVAGRLTLLNRSQGMRRLRVETCGLLIPLEGLPLLVRRMSLVNILLGRTSTLSPVIFMTGEVEAGEGPFPSLRVDFSLMPGAMRQIVWAEAALEEAQASFELARRIAARPWEAEKARIEILNEAQSLHIYTGDVAWDAVLAMSQKEAARLILGRSAPAFVARRGPDDGFSLQPDGPSWEGLSAFEALYLASILPITARPLLEIFLQAQDKSGHIPLLPSSKAFQNVLAAPVLGTLAAYTRNTPFPQEVEKLLAFFWRWFSPSQDSDRDGIPQWSHEAQTGLEAHPLFDQWNPRSQGVEIGTVNSPALLALLVKEAEILQLLGKENGPKEQLVLLEAQVMRLRAWLERAWNPRKARYLYLDREAQTSFRGKILLRHKGNGHLRLAERFKKPVRLQIDLFCEARQCHPRITLWEGDQVAESVQEDAVRLRPGGLSFTSRRLYRALDAVEIEGIGLEDEVIVRVPDLEIEDITTLLPLWAGVPTSAQAEALLKQAIENPQRFSRPFGLSSLTRPWAKEAEPPAERVELLWNWLIGEGMLRYGFRRQAAHLVERLMAAAIQNLQKHHAFYRSYDAERGEGIGERGHLLGIFPLSLFLKTLGVEIYSPTLLRLEGYNPFPWPVRLRYRGLEILREAQQTEVTFPQGQRLVVTTTAPCLVTLRRERAEVSSAH
uniref:Glycosyl hydrolase family 37 n=1 Tax=uncultured Chloroflexota bacterium TaxID=166587 RepID=H5SAK0_9CHLR|nr:glycosyl hydrolase family 37 [uncultured Chloroflexota bacterium]